MRIADSLGSAIASVAAMFGRGGEGRAPLDLAYTAEAGILAYLSSGMLRKTIRIPASDRTSKWRDWQADGDAIGKIEDEENRLGLRQKVKQAEILRGLGGGALILIVAGENHDQPLNPASVRPGGLVAVNVVSRWQITGLDWDQNLASPTYGEPRMWQVSGSGQQQKIHPSRVVTFRGDPLTVGYGVGSHEQAYWGDCRLQAVLREVLRSDDAQAWFAALVRKAKLLRVGIPDLLDMMASPEGKQQLNERMRLIAEGESVLNAVVYRSGTGADDPGEKIDDYQITWAGIPAVMDAFDQRVAAVADIPFTRLMGRSPAGMNATGSHDEANYWTSISSDQENDLRPCLRKIDPFLLASAGVPEKGVTWIFSPLSTPSEKDRTDTIKTMTDALKNLHDMAVMPEQAFNEAAQNLLMEDGVLPGLDQILAKFSEDERFGIVGTMDPSLGDPSALTVPQAKGGDPSLNGGAGGVGNAPARRAANDAKPIPLYVQRKLLNAPELIAWAKEQGFKSTLPASDMHVTVLYSRTPVDPIKMGETWSGDEKGNMTIKPGGPRAIEKLGEDAVVLLFASSDLVYRHQSMVEAGASHDFPEYQPHVTLSYEAGDVDLAAIKPFTGKLVFGPEIFEPLDLDWKQKVTEE